MTSLDRTAGAVALLQAAALLAIVVFNFALLPTLGLAGPDAFNANAYSVFPGGGRHRQRGFPGPRHRPHGGNS